MKRLARVIAAAKVLGEPLVPTVALWQAIDEFEDPPAPSNIDAWWAAMSRSGPIDRTETSAAKEPASSVRLTGRQSVDWDRL